MTGKKEDKTVPTAIAKKNPKENNLVCVGKTKSIENQSLDYVQKIKGRKTSKKTDGSIV